jgi:predicted amidohydrolase
MELHGAAQIDETTTQLQRNARKTEKLNSQATEQASLLIVVLPRSCLVSAVLAYFCDSLASLDGTKG